MAAGWSTPRPTSTRTPSGRLPSGPGAPISGPEDLARIYQQLDELEPVESDQEAIRPVDELFHWPLALAFALGLAAALFAMWPGAGRKVVAA